MSKKILLFLWLFLGVFSSFGQTPSILWWYDVKDSAFGQSALEDMNKDGKHDVVFGCYRNDSMIYALNGADGSLLWKYNASGWGEGCNDVAVLIYDVDQDGKLDVVVPSSCNPKTYCFDAETGDLKWEAPTRGSDSPPTLADLDGDGKYEIIHGEFGGYVICIDAHTGSIKWEITVDTDSWVQTAPTIVDLDGDGQDDFVVATWNFYENSKVYAYNGADLSLMWTKDLLDVCYHGTAIADLDKDGKPELVIGDYGGMLYALNGEDGSLLWEYNAGSYVGSPASIADLTGNGSCEIVFTSWYKVIALRADGTVLWQHNITDYMQAFRGVALADMDQDGKPDVVYGSSGGRLVGLKGSNGASLWSVDLKAHIGMDFEISTAPVIGDLNGNGKLDVFVVGGKTDYPDFSGNYGRAYAVEIGTGTDTWPMFQYDLKRRSSLCVFDSPAGLGKSELPLFDLYPNPSNQTIKVQLDPLLVGRKYQIVELTGKVVQEGYLTKEQSIVSVQQLPQGQYFFHLEGAGAQKISILR